MKLRMKGRTRSGGPRLCADRSEAEIEPGVQVTRAKVNIEKTESNHDSVFSVNMLTNISHKIFLNNFF